MIESIGLGHWLSCVCVCVLLLATWRKREKKKVAGKELALSIYQDGACACLIAERLHGFGL